MQSDTRARVSRSGPPPGSRFVADESASGAVPTSDVYVAGNDANGSHRCGGG